MSEERPLPGGWISDVTRVGSTVRRTPSPRAAFVRALLEHLGRAGWGGAPRHLGVDEQGREVISYVEGLTVVERPELVVDSDAALTATARLVRELHDLTAGSPLCGGEEVVCHHDLDPRNTVYRETSSGVVPVALIDWDMAAPGRRIQDVARICWQYLRLGPQITDLAETSRRIRLICDAYALQDRAELLDTIVWWQERCWRGMLTGAAENHPAMVRLVESGTAVEIRVAAEWTRNNIHTLAAGL